MEIKICFGCGGSGTIRIDVGTYNSEYKTHTCSICNGTGRIKTKSYFYQVPFDVDNVKIHEIDSEICKLINKVNSLKK